MLQAELRSWVAWLSSPVLNMCLLIFWHVESVLQALGEASAVGLGVGSPH